MLELITPSAPRPHVTGASTPPPLSRLLARALDEVDYGVLLLTAQADVLHANHRARQLLDGAAALTLLGTRLRTSELKDLAPLHYAIVAAATRGLRRLLMLGSGETVRMAALVPVDDGIAALLLGKARVCEDLSIQCFARRHALTAAETRVLAALGSGVTPGEISREQGVKLSTVRTQIGAIRQKIGVPSITALVRLVAALPPMVGALRG